MNVFSRYLIRHLFLGFAAAAGLLLPLFTTFNLINELDDVSPGGYRWTQAVLVVLMTLPRTLVELSPFIALFDAPRDKCTLSCAINGIHAAFHYLKKNYISGCVMTVPTG
ncbi:TPA: LptF/LptG family permease [Escherichia coli]|nr:LptF/LptG family permease [Escherichia coli]